MFSPIAAQKISSLMASKPQHLRRIIYPQIGEKYGVEYSELEILHRYRRAYEQPWGQSRLC
ncbi:hypothetical protein CASFOL_005259 [Castilleja foliolosa]|uniref:Uncharacterized protein n=2 Tax=Castilleja foliolosa TaxID=1961234 RepID=A0ABD3E407_9LAMI